MPSTNPVQNETSQQNPPTSTSSESGSSILSKDFPWEKQPDPVVGDKGWQLIENLRTPWPKLSGLSVKITDVQDGFVQYDISCLQENVKTIQEFKRMYRKLP